MKRNNANIMATAMALVLLAAPAVSQAEDVMTTTTTETVTKSRVDWEKKEEPMVKPGTHLLNLTEFDANKDGRLTRAEIGEKLFHIFDTDGNNLVDNVEYEKKLVATIVPVKETEKIAFYSGDNVTPDKTITTSQDILKVTQLARFDKAGDGLSPHDFAAKDFAGADVDNDHFVKVEEWQGAYDAVINAENEDKQKFNTNK
ncbi:MAG: hypothetical protein ACAH83_17110 [Alphaproteobacteria bacterium]